uniref:Regulator of chromosome condensation n=1 Tax=Hirondellea gigas TaxID=1518452 RepID=A0A6A7FSC9_9CRUS
MYKFVGQLMGLAVRTRQILPLDFPSIIWKSLVNSPITRHDVMMIDYHAFRLIENIEKSLVQLGRSRAEVLDEVLGDAVFATTCSDKKLRELRPGGFQTKVTPNNLGEFCEEFVEYRFSEFKLITNAFREGLASVVPISVLSLFTWQELEVQVCGLQSLDVDLLQKMTKYKHCSSDDSHIKLFWRVVREKLDQAQQAKLLQFIWGRSRLPVRAQDFKTKFQIESCPMSEHGAKHGHKVSDYLPIAHTCFFQLELPKYPTMELMYNKLMMAAEHCSSIDMDHEVMEVDAFFDDDVGEEMADIDQVQSPALFRSISDVSIELPLLFSQDSVDFL